MIRKRPALTSLLLLTTRLLIPAGAEAQTEPDSSRVVPLPEVVVTGTRTPDSIKNIPASITVVNRGKFADARGLSLKDALLGVPGVLVQSRAGAQDIRLTIRGFGARGNGERSNAGVTRGIRVLTDGIPLSEPDGRTSLDLADIGSAGRVEVSRSNASAVYGNASGGVVNLRTDFEFDAPFAQFRGKFGSFGYHREQLYVGVAPGRSRGVLSVSNSTSDGWREHSGSSTSLISARLTSPMDDHTRLGLMLDLVSNLNFYAGPLTAAQADSAPEQANASFKLRNERRSNRVARLAMSVSGTPTPNRDYSLAVWAEPKKLQRSERSRFRDFARGHVGVTASAIERHRFSPSTTGALSVGVDDAWQDGAIQFYDLGPGGSRGRNLKADQREAANSAGGFIQGELTFRERWQARLAGRYDNVYYLSEDHADPELDDSRHFERITPKVSLAWLGQDHTLFATLGGGVEAPAYNEIDPPAPFDTLTSLNPFLETTHSTTMELGGRGTLGAAGRVTYDAALYWIEVKNDFIPFDGGAYYATVGKTRRQGLELGVTWKPTRKLACSSAVTLSRNRYVDYSNTFGDFAGNRVAGLPDRFLHGTVRYTLRPGLAAELALDHVGGYFADDPNRVQVKAYTLLNARVAWSGLFERQPMHLFLGIDNITDAEHTSSVFINGTNGQYFEPGLPRTVTAGLTLGL